MFMNIVHIRHVSIFLRCRFLFKTASFEPLHYQIHVGHCYPNYHWFRDITMLHFSTITYSHLAASPGNQSQMARNKIVQIVIELKSLLSQQTHYENEGKTLIF